MARGKNVDLGSKPILVQLGEHWRVSRYDDRNLILIQYTRVINKTTGEARYSWALRGYYSNLRMALRDYLRKFIEAVDDGSDSGDPDPSAQAIIDRIVEAERTIQGLDLCDLQPVDLTPSTASDVW